jgi:hypothetical protein
VVTCLPGVRRGSVGRIRELQRYREILVDEGFTVKDSPHVAEVLRITLPE